MSRIAVFADVQNIYYTTRQAFGRQFNYRALWEQLCNQGEVVSAMTGRPNSRMHSNTLVLP